MSDGAKFATAILAMFGAMLCFYFAFHPNGAEDAIGSGPVQSGPDILRAIISRFQNAAGMGGTS